MRARLMTRLVFDPIADQIPDGTYTLYDGAMGTGGMLTVAEETLQDLAKASGKRIVTNLFGQEINAETYAIAVADLLLKGEGTNADGLVGGPEYSTLSNDAFAGRTFDFMLSNPPYGKSWATDHQRMGGKKEIIDPRFIVDHDTDPEFSPRHPFQRRADALFGQHGLEDEEEHAAGQPHRRGPQWVFAFHRRRRPGRVEHPSLHH